MAFTSGVSKEKSPLMRGETIQDGLRDGEDTPTNPDGISPKGLFDGHRAIRPREGIAIDLTTFSVKEFDVRVGQLGVQNRNILHIASENGNENFIAHVVAKYPQLSTWRDAGNNLPLHIAASKGSRNAVEACLNV